MIKIFIIAILYSFHELLKDNIQFVKTILPDNRFWNIGKASAWYDSMKAIPVFALRPLCDGYHLSMTLAWNIVFYSLKPKDTNVFAWLFLCNAGYAIFFEATRFVLTGGLSW